MIRLALAFILFTMPAALVAGFLLTLFPHIPAAPLVIITTVIVLGLAYGYVRRRKDYFIREGIPEQTPQWLSQKRYGAFLIIGTLFGSVAMTSFNKTSLYIDNGSDKSITVKLKYEGSITIPAHSYVEKTVVTGENEGTVDGRTIKMNIDDKGNWIWNVNAENTYILTKVSYSSNIELYKNGKGPDEEEDNEDYKLIRDEFFNSKADYIFKAPESISVKRSRFSSGKDVEKTVLYRLSDLADEYDPPSKKIEVADPEGEVIQEK